MVPPVPQILQPASLPNFPVIHHQQPQVIYLQPVQPTEFIVVSQKKPRATNAFWEEFVLLVKLRNYLWFTITNHLFATCLTNWIYSGKQRKSQGTPDWLFTRPVLQKIAAMKSGFIQNKINWFYPLRNPWGSKGCPVSAPLRIGNDAFRQKIVNTFGST